MDGNLLLNVGPDALGRIPGESVAILKELATWMSANAASIHGARKASLPPPCGMTYTAKGDDLYLHLFSPPMGDIILPKLNGKIDSITLLADGADVPMITSWGSELLLDDDIRIRPPTTIPPMSVLRIATKKAPHA
jgi:alpha-L-fucosidase